MYLFEIDKTHNRMHIMLSDHFTVAEADKLLLECESRMADVDAGYNILCDLTSLETFEYQAKRIYRKVMDICNATGAKKVIRVFADPMETFGMSIMSTFHYNDDVEIVSTDSFTRAMKHLE